MASEQVLLLLLVTFVVLVAVDDTIVQVDAVRDPEVPDSQVAKVETKVNQIPKTSVTVQAKGVVLSKPKGKIKDDDYNGARTSAAQANYVALSNTNKLKPDTKINGDCYNVAQANGFALSSTDKPKLRPKAKIHSTLWGCLKCLFNKSCDLHMECN